VRIVVFGAGAVGGVIGGRLFEHGHGVVLIARGSHGEALRSGGLRLESPAGSSVLPVPVVGAPSEIEWRPGDAVVLAMKSQDTLPALRSLAAVAPPELPVLCAQNGVENERLALRFFQNVYGICVMLPATHLEPGVVQAHASPISGLLDIGRWPDGRDEVAQSIAVALAESTFDSIAREDIGRWKYGKLLMNLGNAVEALSGRNSEKGLDVARSARREGVASLQAAAIQFVDKAEDAERRGDLLQTSLIAGQERKGGSSWQSLARSAGTIEADYLNGEIVLLGRLHGVRTPVNEALQRLANEFARERRQPGSMPEAELLARVSPPGA
jgi:2-dehydropantoate 2-reductase